MPVSRLFVDDRALRSALGHTSGSLPESVGAIELGIDWHMPLRAPADTTCALRKRPRSRLRVHRVFFSTFFLPQFEVQGLGVWRLRLGSKPLIWNSPQ